MKKLFYSFLVGTTLVLSLTSCDKLKDKNDTDGKIEVIDFKANKEFFNMDENINFTIRLKNDESYKITTVQIGKEEYPVKADNRYTILECNNNFKFNGPTRYDLNSITYHNGVEEKKLEVENKYCNVNEYIQKENVLAMGSVSLTPLNNGTFTLHSGAPLRLNYNIKYDSLKSIGNNDYLATNIICMLERLDDKGAVIPGEVEDNISLLLPPKQNINASQQSINGSCSLQGVQQADHLINKQGNFRLTVKRVNFQNNGKSLTSEVSYSPLTFKVVGSGVQFGRPTLANAKDLGYNIQDRIIISGDSDIKVNVKLIDKNLSIRDAILKDDLGNTFETTKVEKVDGTLGTNLTFKYKNIGNKKANVNLEIAKINLTNGNVLEFVPGEMKISSDFTYYPVVVNTVEDLTDKVLNNDSILKDSVNLNTAKDKTVLALGNDKILNANMDLNGKIVYSGEKSLFKEIKQNASISNGTVLGKCIDKPVIADINYGKINNIIVRNLSFSENAKGGVVRDNKGTISNIEIHARYTLENEQTKIGLICETNSDTIKNIMINNLDVVNDNGKTDITRLEEFYLDAITNTGTITNVVVSKVNNLFSVNKFLSSSNNKETFRFVFVNADSKNKLYSCVLNLKGWNKNQIYNILGVESFIAPENEHIKLDIRGLGFVNNGDTYWRCQAEYCLIFHQIKF